VSIVSNMTELKGFPVGCFAEEMVFTPTKANLFRSVLGPLDRIGPH
jgi:hypothetical protein